MRNNNTFSNAEFELVNAINAFNNTKDISSQNNKIVKLLEMKNGESVLDVGCSLGHLCKLLASLVGKDGNVTGVDISELIIAHAEKSNPYQWLKFYKGDAMNIDIKDSKMDVITCVQLAEYLPYIDPFLSNIFRILKGNGRCVIVTTDWNSLEWVYWPKIYTQKWKGHCHNSELHTILKEKLKKVGFKSVLAFKHQIVNSHFLPIEYSYWLSTVVNSYMKHKDFISNEYANKWVNMLKYSDEIGNYHFKVNRYMFLAKK